MKIDKNSTTNMLYYQSNAKFNVDRVDQLEIFVHPNFLIVEIDSIYCLVGHKITVHFTALILLSIHL